MDRKRSRKMGRKSAKAGMSTKRLEGRMFSDADREKFRPQAKNYQSGGSVMNDMDAIDMAVAKILADESGKTISDA